jgi:hypothetical protein
MSHNPTIQRSGDTYLLFYTGSTFRGPTPTPASPARSGTPMILEARANQRIGLATSKSIDGPWARLDHPILEPRPGRWDALMTTNPAPCPLPDGGVHLLYKSARDHGDRLRIGVARADLTEGPYERAKDEELFEFPDPADHVEDAYVWRDASRFELLMKDMSGGISGEKGAGVHATSRDGIDWAISRPPKAYSLTIAFDDGSRRTLARVERPQLLMERGRARMLYVAVAASGPTTQIAGAWNQPIPVRG